MTTASQRERLAEELVRARRRAGLSGRDMMAVLGVTQAQVYRYDHAVTVPSLPKVRAWLDACREAAPESVDDDTRARLLELAEEVHAQPRSWSAMRRAGVRQAQDTAAEQDADAREVWTAQNVILPGLLQTPEYAAAAVARADLHGQFDHVAQLAARLARQALLFEPGRRWRFLLAEHLLSWSPGAEALMGPQRARVAALAATEGVEVAVVPTGAQPEPSGLWWSPFTVLHPRDEESYVDLELVHGQHTVREADEVASYGLLWERLWSAALRGDEALTLIRTCGD